MLQDDYSTTPVCQHFGICGGCKLQGIDKKSYIKIKNDLVLQPLSYEGVDFLSCANPILIPSGNRRRCTLKATKQKDQLLLGYHEMKSHSIVDIKECPLLTNELQKLIEPLKTCLKSILSSKATHDIIIAQSESGFDLILDSLKNLTLDQTNRLITFAQQNKVSRIQLKYKDALEPVVAFETPVLHFDNIAVDCDADGFMQASTLSDQILSELVTKEIPENSKRGLDLFCGRGTFSLPLSSKLSIDAFDLEARSVNVLQKAAHKAGRNITARVRNLFEAPLEQKELAKYDFAVINPPRAGALKQCKFIASSNIQKLVMVSCEPKTFARDAKILIDGGYKLENITPVDQFIWSNHIEIVGVFSK